MVDLRALTETLEELEALDYRKTYQKFYDFRPHPKQRDHLNLGKTKRERLLMANNRGGKTLTGAFEAACHLTGEYPDDWDGRRFAEPTIGWIAGETSLLVRDVQQGKLCGPPGVDAMFGSGMIPKDLFVDKPSLARGVTDAYDTIQVRHKSGGISIGKFKSYEQGRPKFQGEGLDWIWFDEEPPLDIYAEGIARIGERDGISWLTFTPLQGPTAVVLRFMDEPSPDRAVTTMTLDDAAHIPPDVRKKMEDGYLPHERDARARGIPMLGSGRIFTAPEDSIVEEAIEHIPPYWKKLWGIDFGIDHPFAAVLILWDLDADVIHVHHAYRVKDALPIQHAAAMKKVGASVPIAWPNDGNIRRDDGKPMADHYKRHGAMMLPEHATWPDGSVSTEAGILEMVERERSGQLKYAKQLSDLLEERRMYHRKADGSGQIVKQRDDLISALRTAIMMKRAAKSVQLGSQRAVGAYGPAGVYAVGTPNHAGGDMDAFTGG